MNKDQMGKVIRSFFADTCSQRTILSIYLIFILVQCKCTHWHWRSVLLAIITYNRRDLALICYMLLSLYQLCMFPAFGYFDYLT